MLIDRRCEGAENEARPARKIEPAKRRTLRLEKANWCRTSSVLLALLAACGPLITCVTKLPLLLRTACKLMWPRYPGCAEAAVVS
jgi:hypothetical protein